MTVQATNCTDANNKTYYSDTDYTKKHKEVGIPNVWQAGAYLSNNTQPVNNIGNILANC